MERTIQADENKKISFAPVSELEEIYQNIRTILTTIRGSVPLDRDFGVDGDLIDQPTPVARAKLSGEIVGSLKKYEPRVKVIRVSFNEGMDGKVSPAVTVMIND